VNSQGIEKGVQRMKKKWKIILGGAAVLVILGVFLTRVNTALEADVLRVEPRSVAKTFEEKGEVAAQVHYPAAPLVSGKIINLPVQEGDRVKKGDILAEIDAQELQYQLAQAEAELKSTRGEEIQTREQPYGASVNSQKLVVEQAERDVEMAQTDLARSEVLYQSGIITKKEYEDAQNNLKTAQNNLAQQKQALSLLYESNNPGGGTKEYYAGRKEALQAQIDLLKYKIESCRMVSPMDGVVSDLNVKEGQVAETGMPMMNIFQDQAYEVEVYVLTQDILNVKQGEEVDLVLDTGGEDITFKGAVTSIAPSAVEKTSALGLEEKRIKVTVKPETPPSLVLRPGYELDVTFTVSRQENKLAVPKTALFPYESGDALWVVKDGKARIQPVIKGMENEKDAVIEKGLEKGDLVILNPQLKDLKEGAKIK